MRRFYVREYVGVFGRSAGALVFDSLYAHRVVARFTSRRAAQEHADELNRWDASVSSDDSGRVPAVVRG